MDKKNKTPAEVETVTVTMSRPVAEAVQTACEMYLRLHMGQFNDLAEDLCMAKHYADMDAKRFKNAEAQKEDFYRALENRNMMQDDMDRAYQMFACHPLIEDGMACRAAVMTRPMFTWMPCAPLAKRSVRGQRN